ncbi:MAG: FtsQ-type POTRA domain-containing protein [Deltaproteobacteria bacterium]|jgi:cell division protein FtsQ|nr:FtsQ-type POTRA domain-containing protein [Deltaproteobacteria bacterium]
MAVTQHMPQIAGLRTHIPGQPGSSYDPFRNTGFRAPKKIELKKISGSSRIRRNLQQNIGGAEKRGLLGKKLYSKLRVLLRWFFIISLILLIFFGAGLGLARIYRHITTSAYFALKSIDIEGQSRLRSREILNTMGLRYGRNILALSMRDMGRALAGNPWVAEFSIKRVFPDGIRIKIRENEPKYWVRINGELAYADDAGNPIAPVSAGTFSSLPLLEIEKGAEYLSGELPLIVQAVEHLDFPLKVSAASGIRLNASKTLEISLNRDIRLIIGLDNREANILNLGRVLKDLSQRGELKYVSEIKAHGRDVWVSRRGGRL